jgi:hypothetical protein
MTIESLITQFSGYSIDEIPILVLIPKEDILSKPHEDENSA